ncbi:MAG: hypothetical protein LBT70_04035 [Holosporaceae bacterium]|nr:hypothetical protein [Holosporaceae bacterium]
MSNYYKLMALCLVCGVWGGDVWCMQNNPYGRLYSKTVARSSTAANDRVVARYNTEKAAHTKWKERVHRLRDSINVVLTRLGKQPIVGGQEVDTRQLEALGAVAEAITALRNTNLAKQKLVENLLGFLWETREDVITKNEQSARAGGFEELADAWRDVGVSIDDVLEENPPA